MQKTVLGIAAILIFGLALTSGPAAARDYPYCIQGGGWGVPGDCSYRSYGECQASASGRLVYCSVNPRFAFNQQSRRPRPYPR
jgi:hypothetical protein